MESQFTFSMNLGPDAQDVVGTNVRKVQYLLRERGYNVVPDGFYGLRTEGRVREFQAQEGLRIDGLVPRVVAQYIAEHGLYRAPAEWSA